MSTGIQRVVNLLPAGTLAATTTSGRVSLAGVRRATVFITTDNNWSFACKASCDNGTTEVTIANLIGSTASTNVLVRGAAVVVNNTSDYFTIPLELDATAFESMTVTGTRTGGNWTVGKVVLEYNP